MSNAEINPNLAMAMARQFGITIMHGEAEKIVQMLRTMHWQGFENGQAIEREACAMVADVWKPAYPHPSCVIADTIRARVTV